eukprot:15447287-Alexandrium_andersonii.AAC.1
MEHILGSLARPERIDGFRATFAAMGHENVLAKLAAGGAEAAALDPPASAADGLYPLLTGSRNGPRLLLWSRGRVRALCRLVVRRETRLLDMVLHHHAHGRPEVRGALEEAAKEELRRSLRAK